MQMALMRPRWYGLFLGTSQTAREPIREILRDFLDAYVGSGCAPGMAMFSQTTDKDERGEDQVNVYFSPAAGQFARTIARAAPFPPRDKASLVFVGGDLNWSAILYP